MNYVIYRTKVFPYMKLNSVEWLATYSWEIVACFTCIYHRLKKVETEKHISAIFYNYKKHGINDVQIVFIATG